MKRPASNDGDIFLVAQIAAAIAIAAFFYFFRNHDLLLYGDAVAHINIARRVIDSRTPGPLQLGTVWLPLPHLLMLPFVWSRWMWQTGVAGSFPSMLSYVFSVVGVFRLVRSVLPAAAEAEKSWMVRIAPWLAAAVVACNPNLIYLQATAMTEPVYLALFIWAIVFFAEAIRSCRVNDFRRGNASLVRSGWCLLAACLTRYDGWFLAAVMVAIAMILTWRFDFRRLRSGVIKFAVIAAVAPCLWLAYNAIVYGNALEFANGPYSAKAIEQKTAVPGFPSHPGADSLPVAFHYFFKSAQLNMANETASRPEDWRAVGLQRLWVTALLLGTAIVLLFQTRFWPALLLWTPVPFYMLSIAHGGVPIFMPVWWPFSYYNVRYGIELLPAFAVLEALALYGLLRFAGSLRARAVLTVVFLLLPFLSYLHAVKTPPVSFEEAVVNARSRVVLERQLASMFNVLPRGSTFLVYLGDHVGAFQRAGIPLSDVINEGNHRMWKRPSDLEGLWERALAHPASFVDYVVTFDHGPVASQVNRSELKTMLVIHVSGQPEVTIYQTNKSNQPR
jgi:hypothetical protein